MSGRVNLSRRHFLQIMGSATGALLIGVRSVLADAPGVPVPLALSDEQFASLGPYLRIDSDGTALIGARDPDTGTGVATALPRIIAEELDADWNKVRVVALGLGVENQAGKPAWTYGEQRGGTGTSIPSAWRELRQAGALARALLLQAAAQKLKLDATQLRTEQGRVIAADGRSLSYGQLAGDAANLTPPKQMPPLKNPRDFKLIGLPTGDVDARAIVTGQQMFSIDHFDGLVAVLARCPWSDGQLEQLDSQAALAIKGVLKVVSLTPEPNIAPGETLIAPAVAVIAENSWAALQARKQLKLSWKPGPSGSENNGELEHQAFDWANGADDPTIRVRNDGDVVAAARKAVRKLDLGYALPWLAHVTSEPMNCQITLTKDKATLVVPSQLPRQAWAVVRRITNLDPDKIEVQVPRVGGGYGRRLDHDFVAEAVMLAQQLDDQYKGRPLKVIWTAEDDLTHDFYQSGSVHRIVATLDGKRNLLSWNQRTASASALAQRGLAEQQLWRSEVDANQFPAGLVANYRSDWFALQSLMPRGPARGAPHVNQAFAVESFIDELAHMLKEDPLKTRQRLIGPARQITQPDGSVLDTGKLLNVLALVADRIGWKDWLHTVNGLGLACWHIDGAYVAHAIEAIMQGERLVINRVVCAVDVGRVINPRGLEGQVAGATLDALSNALNPQITFKDGQVQQHERRDYPLASMAQLPNAVEVISVPSQAEPTGASFLAMPTAAPALANAVFRVSAVRVRRLPLMKELLRLL